MWRKHKTWFMWLCNIAAFSVLLLFGLQCSRAYDSEYQARMCEENVQRVFQAETLREWAEELLANEDRYHNTVPMHPLLKGIWKHPPSVQIRGKAWGNNGPAYVWVRWGSGVLGGWGIAIGADDLPPPPEVSNARKWQDGIYFWRKLS